MENKEAVQSIKLGYSYNDEVLDTLDERLTGNEELAYQLIRNLDLALKQFTKADELEPDLVLEDGSNTKTGKAFSFALKGVVQNMGLGKRSQAISNLKKSIEICDDIGVAHHSIGLIYAESGDKEKGFEHLRKAVELEPNNIEYKKNLDRLENVSGFAMKYSSFRGSKKVLLIWSGLTLISLIAGFSDPNGFIAFVIFGAITFLYWRVKTRK